MQEELHDQIYFDLKDMRLRDDLVPNHGISDGRVK